MDIFADQIKEIDQGRFFSFNVCFPYDRAVLLFLQSPQPHYVIQVYLQNKKKTQINIESGMVWYRLTISAFGVSPRNHSYILQ
jgi:hypothetical protein